MKKSIVIITILLGIFLVLAGTIYWFEAEKEVRILCSLFQEGQAVTSVQETLETGNLLHYTIEDEQVLVNSAYTLNSTECMVQVSGNTVAMESIYHQSFRLERVAGGLAAILTFGLAIFQLLLALGVPWGAWAWGGFHKGKLPGKLRIGSWVSFLLLSFGGLTVLSASGLLTLIPESISKVAVALLTLLFLGSIVGNFNSQSRREKQVMIPLSILLFCSYLVIVIFTFS